MFPSVRVFAPLMRQRVTIAPLASYDAQGEPTYGTPVAYRCAVVGVTRKVMNARTKQEVLSQMSVYLMSNAVVRPEDQITLSTEDAGSTENYALHPQIYSVGRYPFLRGQFATAVYLGATHGGQGG